MTAEALKSYWQWWQELGVDQDYAETPHGWLEAASEQRADASHTAKQIEARSQNPTALSPALHKHAPVMTTPSAPAILASGESPPESDAIALPGTIEAMQTWWSQSDALHTESGIGPRIIPTLKSRPLLLLISDMPDEDDHASLFSGRTGTMVDGILHAAGIARDDCAFVSILPQYCADPESELTARPFWRKLVAHQIGLVQPQYVMLASKIANMAVTENDLAENRRSLRFINHGNSNIPASASFHPRILATKPAMKRAAWRDWLRLKGFMDVEITGRD